MKKWYREALAKQGIVLSLEDERAYVRKEQEQISSRLHAVMSQKQLEADQARYQNRVFDVQNANVARQQNREFDAQSDIEGN